MTPVPDLEALEVLRARIVAHLDPSLLKAPYLEFMLHPTACVPDADRFERSDPRFAGTI